MDKKQENVVDYFLDGSPGSNRPYCSFHRLYYL